MDGIHLWCALGLWGSSQYLFCHQCYFVSELKKPETEGAEQILTPTNQSKLKISIQMHLFHASCLQMPVIVTAQQCVQNGKSSA